MSATPIKVWLEGSPGGSMWPMPPETWEQIQSGVIKDTKGLFVSVDVAIRLHAQLTASQTNLRRVAEWCSSEGGTPRVTDEGVSKACVYRECGIVDAEQLEQSKIDEWQRTARRDAPTLIETGYGPAIIENAQRESEPETDTERAERIADDDADRYHDQAVDRESDEKRSQ